MSGFLGLYKPPPAPRPRSKMEAQAFTTDSITDAKNEATITGKQNSSSSVANKDSSANSISVAQEEMKLAAEQPNTDPSTSMARPIDLYKVWHAIGRDRKPIRKQYVEAILPPFVAVIRRWPGDPF